MIVVMLMGGLGNQMFQFAFGKFLSIKYNVPLFLNLSEYMIGTSSRTFDLEIFNISEYESGDGGDIKMSVTIDDIVILNESFFHYDQDILSSIDEIKNFKQKLVVVKGYWQSWKYFLSIETLIRQQFSFKKSLRGIWSKKHDEILSKTSVMIHVRRGDYLESGYHGVVSEFYLEQAIANCQAKLHNPVFFIFSDDETWCRQYFANHQQINFVGGEYFDDQCQQYLQLMCSCRHFIMSNSTFCWWAVWLGQKHDSHIIYPKNWFVTDECDIKDLPLSSWVGL